MFATPLTSMHTVLSLAAIVAGIPAIAHLLGRPGPDRWTVPFLVLAILATLTGFLFPFVGFTPAFGVGIVSTVVLVLVLVARYGFHLAGGWRVVNALGLVISLYFLVFVLIAQLFQKVPALNALAPTGSGRPSPARSSSAWPSSSGSDSGRCATPAAASPRSDDG